MIFVSDPRVSRALLCTLFHARATRRRGPDDIRLPPRRHSYTPRRLPSTPAPRLSRLSPGAN
jgi:hypothetical protein